MNTSLTDFFTLDAFGLVYLTRYVIQNYCQETIQQFLEIIDLLKDEYVTPFKRRKVEKFLKAHFKNEYLTLDLFVDILKFTVDIDDPQVMPNVLNELFIPFK